MTIHATVANKQALKLEDRLRQYEGGNDHNRACHAGIVDSNLSCLNSRHLQVLAG